MVDGTLYVGSASGETRVYASDAGVEGSSDGSRVRPGTPGHHDAWADHAASDVDLSSGPPGYGGWLDGVDNDEGTVDFRGRDQVRVTVGAETEDGPYAFDPPAILVDPGTAVVWEWADDEPAHSVTEEFEDFDSGVVGEAGHTFSYTFAEEGIYRYRCLPHEGLGMRGAVAVGSVDDELIDPEGSRPATPTRTPDPTDTRTGTPDPTDPGTPTDLSSVETPGPGIAGALAGLGGVAAMLARRGRDGEE